MDLNGKHNLGPTVGVKLAVRKSTSMEFGLRGARDVDLFSGGA